jgi:hypothetical protein
MTPDQLAVLLLFIHSNLWTSPPLPEPLPMAPSSLVCPNLEPAPLPPFRHRR